MGLTDIPTRTDNSLGRVKTDAPGSKAPNLAHDVPAAEWERIKTAIIDSANAIGLGDGTTPGSIAQQFSNRVFNIKDSPFNAVGDGVVDDTAAVQAALAAVLAHGAGTIEIPGGTYKITSKLNVLAPTRLVGHGINRSILHFSPNTGIWMVPNGNDYGAQRSTVEYLDLRGTKQSYVEWQPNHVYSVGDRRRSVAAALGTTGDTGQFPNAEVDRGIHLRCTTAGTSASSQPSFNLVGDETVNDGSVVWTTEIDCGINIRAAFITVRQCQITNFDDCGILIYGDGNVFISDGALIENNTIVGFDGHCIYASGDDSQLSHIARNNLSNAFRGCGIRDAAFLNSTHLGNQAINCKFPFAGAGNAARTLWLGNYAEACEGGIWIHGDQHWLLGSLNAIDSRSQGRIDDGARQGRLWLDFKNGFARFLGGSQPWDQWLRYGDHGNITDEWRTNDSGDLGGYLRQAWIGLPDYGCRDITGTRSNKGPAKWRFSRGYYMGPCWHTFLNHAPGPNDNSVITGTTLWQPGDMVWNTNTSSDTIAWWTAQRKGGWGGGLQYSGGRVWVSGAGDIHCGDAMEPSTPNGHVFWLYALEAKLDVNGVESVSGTWQTAPYDHTTLSTTEPTWTTGTGDDIYEYTNGNSSTATERIHWKEWGLVGMTWNQGPKRTGTETT